MFVTSLIIICVTCAVRGFVLFWIDIVSVILNCVCFEMLWNTESNDEPTEYE